MMKTIINIVLGVGIIAALYFLYSTVSEPIIFKKEYTTRTKAVQDKLASIKNLQELHKTIKGDYAYSFDSLKYVLQHDSLPVRMMKKVDTTITMITIKTPAIDSVKAMAFDLDSISYIPFSNQKFVFKTDSIQMGDFKEPVLKISAPYKSFLGNYADEKYKKYNTTFDPKDEIAIGSLQKTTLAANW